jgi:putative ABC transport system substrate-binding protein
VLIRLLGLIAVALCLFGSAPTSAQTASKLPRIGVLWQTSPPPPIHPHISALLKNLQDLGWHEGRTVAFEYRYAGNDAVRLDELARELVRLKVDVITTAGDLSTRAAQQATTTIPIVALVGFPVESGFAKSLSRPGGNVTGFAVIAVELSVKRLELLKELVPRLSRVAVLWDPVTHERQLKAVEAAARGLGLEVQVLRAKSESEFAAAFEAATKARAEAMLVMISPTYVGKRNELVRLAAQYRIPAMYHSPAFTEVGGLIAYGPSLEEQWQKIAGTIDRVLKGARAAELPFQQPTRFELDVNLKAAREIGLEVPQLILMRASRVIE